MDKLKIKRSREGIETIPCAKRVKTSDWLKPEFAPFISACLQRTTNNTKLPMRVCKWAEIEVKERGWKEIVAAFSAKGFEKAHNYNAIASRYERHLKHLLSQTKSVWGERNNELIAAVAEQGEYLEVFRYLLGAKSTNSKWTFDPFACEQKVLTYLAEEDRYKWVELLLKDSRFDFQTYEMEEAIANAIVYGRKNTVWVFLKDKRLKLDDPKFSEALELACDEDHYDIAKLVLEDGRISVGGLAVLKTEDLSLIKIADQRTPLNGWEALLYWCSMNSCQVDICDWILQEKIKDHEKLVQEHYIESDFSKLDDNDLDAIDRLIECVSQPTCKKVAFLKGVQKGEFEQVKAACDKKDKRLNTLAFHLANYLENFTMAQWLLQETASPPKN